MLQELFAIGQIQFGHRPLFYQYMVTTFLKKTKNVAGNLTAGGNMSGN